MTVQLWNSARYGHYFMTLVAFFPVMYWMVGNYREKVKYMAASALLIIILLFSCRSIYDNSLQAVNAIVNWNKESEESQMISRIEELVPDDEHDSFAGYNISSHFYLETGINSCYKYFILNDHHSRFDDSVREEMTAMFLSGEAKWILVNGEIANVDILDYLDKEYEVIEEFETYRLLRK